MTGYPPVSKKRRKLFFRHRRRRRFPLIFFCFSHFPSPLGLPSSENVRSIIKNIILGYHFHRHNN